MNDHCYNGDDDFRASLCSWWEKLYFVHLWIQRRLQNVCYWESQKISMIKILDIWCTLAGLKTCNQKLENNDNVLRRAPGIMPVRCPTALQGLIAGELVPRQAESDSTLRSAMTCTTENSTAKVSTKSPYGFPLKVARHTSYGFKRGSLL